MTDRKSAAKRKELAPALTRGLRILDIVASGQGEMSMSQIGRELGLAKSSVHGLCAALVAARFLERTPSGAYRLGLKLVDLANARLESSDLPAEFYSVWDDIGVYRREAAVLAVLDGAEVIYIACRNSTLPLGVTFRIGMKLPACCTATGKAMLSTFADEEVRTFYSNHELARPTTASVSSVDALIEQLRVVRSRGYSIDDGETRDHMWSLGAPVLGRENTHAVAAVAVSFLRSDRPQEQVRKIAEVVCKFAAILSKGQGASAEAALR